MPISDFYLATKIDYIPWKVRVKFLRDLSWVFNARTVQEKSLINLFLAINQAIKPKTFYDIGANIGFYSWLLLAHQVEDFRAILFEPDPENISLLKKTISRAKLANTQLISSAVSNRIGQANFAIDKITGATGTLETGQDTFIERQYGHKKPNLVNVNTVTLDYLIEQKQILPPDLIKIDVEGSEHKVFAGARNLIENHQPIVIFEYSKENKQSLSNYLQELGYFNFNANTLDRDVSQAANILSIPQKYHDCIDMIFAECNQVR